MKLIIDIPDMIYNILNGNLSWNGLSIDYILNAVKDGTPLEVQPTGMRDATEEERKSVKDYVDSISKPTGVNFNELLRDCGTCKHNTAIDCGQYPCNECNRKTHPLYEPKITQPPDEDCISREAVLELAKKGILVSNDNYKCVVNAIKSLPPVTPQKPKGKWIEIEIDAGEFIYKCTECGMRVINPYKYCPICGSYNGGDEDEAND